jgi:hypothetical protein
MIEPAHRLCQDGGKYLRGYTVTFKKLVIFRNMLLGADPPELQLSLYSSRKIFDPSTSFR